MTGINAEDSPKINGFPDHVSQRSTAMILDLSSSEKACYIQNISHFTLIASFFPANNPSSIGHGNLKPGPPQKPGKDMQIIPAISAESVISKGDGKLHFIGYP